jgi:hypothetical protein
VELRFGAGYRIKGWETEVNYNAGSNPMFRWGNSLEIMKHVKILAGIKFDSKDVLENNIHLGIDINLEPYSISYSLVPKTVLGLYHFISIKREF